MWALFCCMNEGLLPAGWRRVLSLGSCHLASAPEIMPEDLLDLEMGLTDQEPLVGPAAEEPDDLEGTTLEMGPPEEAPLVGPAPQAPADGPATQAPADGPAGHAERPCRCCYYSMSEEVDPEQDPTFRTCGWFWSAQHESWVWWHGHAPHAPFHMQYHGDDQAPADRTL